MAKLYTKTGDDGTTSLFDGQRVLKNDSRVAAYGDVDELNAAIGLAASMVREGAPAPAGLLERLRQIQHTLFNVGAELATPAESRRTPKSTAVGEQESARLEGWIDEASAAVPALSAFILPGGSPLSSQLHFCRTVARRAERSIVTLMGQNAPHAEVLIYINRLSDLFFAWARWANQVAEVADEVWVTRQAHPKA